ncbi:MAG: Serine hydroxymethyltransferase [Chlamydiae bacterium]|nr:Serine hydroxymethyltransferase [Chlamydiota bacterium]
MSHLKRYLENQTNLNPGAVAFLASLDQIATVSPKIAQAIIQELKDQKSYLKLIASENFSSLAVQLAMGNLLTDKYSEGFPHHRFYAGCDNVDTVEDEAVRLACEIFECEHAYVQPHSGADANLVAFWSILFQRVQNRELEKLGKKNLNELTNEEHERIRQLMMNQKMMGMSLNSGGHLTHGYRHNVSSKMMHAVTYEIDIETGLLNYDMLAAQAKEEKPDILLAGYSAYPRLINFATMREIADSVGAVFMVDMAHFSGLVAGKVFTGDYNPIPHAHIVTSTTHKTLRGPRGGIVLCTKEYADIVNKGCPIVLGGPLPHVMAAKAVAFQEANTPEFQQYSQRIVENARALAEALMKRGVDVLTGGTDNHLILLNITKFGITGRQAEIALRRAHITCNRNAIPFDKNGPWYTSGVRIGTPATTTLGMGPQEMVVIAEVIFDILSNTEPTIVQKTQKPSKAQSVTEEKVLSRAQDRIKELLQNYPLYPEIELSHTNEFIDVK